MIWTDTEKQSVKRIVISQLKDEPEVQRIVVFGSFLALTKWMLEKSSMSVNVLKWLSFAR